METILKHNYITPDIKRINLDNEISLQLESTPPGEGNPWETNNNSTPDYFNHNPMQKA